MPLLTGSPAAHRVPGGLTRKLSGRSGGFQRTRMSLPFGFVRYTIVPESYFPSTRMPGSAFTSITPAAGDAAADDAPEPAPTISIRAADAAKSLAFVVRVARMSGLCPVPGEGEGSRAIVVVVLRRTHLWHDCSGTPSGRYVVGWTVRPADPSRTTASGRSAVPVGGNPCFGGTSHCPARAIGGGGHCVVRGPVGW